MPEKKRDRRAYYATPAQRARHYAYMKGYRQRPAVKTRLQQQEKAYRSRPDVKLAVQLKRYGMTLDQFWDAVQQQRGLCANQGCGVPLDDKARLHIDHSHSSGAFRGLLCLRCNLALDYAHDSTLRLAGLIVYLSDKL